MQDRGACSADDSRTTSSCYSDALRAHSICYITLKAYIVGFSEDSMAMSGTETQAVRAEQEDVGSVQEPRLIRVTSDPPTGRVLSRRLDNVLQEDRQRCWFEGQLHFHSGD